MSDNLLQKQTICFYINGKWEPIKELIWCKDCKHRLECDYWVDNGDDWFCANGERKEGQ